MIIIGGLGSILGAFLGAAILHLLPISLRALPAALGLERRGGDSRAFDLYDDWRSDHLLVLIVEPHGLARLWRTTKQKLRVWPFPY